MKKGVASIDREIFLKRLFTPTFISATLKEYGLSLKNRFGQNFLINRDVAEHILACADVDAGDVVLEIGPGLGQLTFLLAERVKRVVAVEIDRGVARYLQWAVRELGIENVAILNGDFLDLELPASNGGADAEMPSDLTTIGTSPTKIVSNFPYSIAIKAIIRILKKMREVSSITGMVQREIAERITARPGSKNYSSVSVLLQYLARIQVIVKKIAPQNFFPVPEVTSAVVSIKPRGTELPVNGELFEKVVKAGFANRRKNLTSNLLASGTVSDGALVREFLVRTFKNEKVRAEKLSVGDFVELIRAIGGVY